MSTLPQISREAMGIILPLCCGDLLSIKVVGFGELFDECAAAPGRGAGRARGGSGGGDGSGRMRAERGGEARVRAASPLAAVIQPLPSLLWALPQVGVGAVHLELSIGQQPTVLRRAVQIRVRRRRAFVTFHLGGLAAADVIGRLAPLGVRLFDIVMVGAVSGRCVILYFTERKVAAVHCRCDI